MPASRLCWRPAQQCLAGARAARAGSGPGPYRFDNASMDASELAVIGLTCNLVGVFLLANSIIFRRTRRVIEEFFGVGAGQLATIKDYSLNKIQIVIGFLFLNAGFLLLLFANFQLLEQRMTTLLVCLSIVLFAALAWGIGAHYSRRSFRRHLREFFQKHTWSFTENMALTKEIGLFLGIRHTKDMTVEEFVHNVKKALHVPPGENLLAGPERIRKVRDISAISGR